MSIIKSTSKAITGVIYGLHNGDGRIRYIGQTVRPTKRFREHKCVARGNSQLPVHRWMRKHGIENIHMTTLETFDAESYTTISDREMQLIAQYREMYGRSMLNVTAGGEGCVGLEVSDETRALQSQSAKSRPDAELVRQRMSENSKKTWADPEHRAKVAKRVSVASMEFWKDEEYRAKCTEALDRGRHTRYHTNKNIIKDGCTYCASAQQEAA